MQVQSMEFKARAGQKLADQRLQQNLKKLSTKFVTARADAVRDIDFDATREALKERRNRALENLDVWLANPDAWAMVVASIQSDSPASPNFHCVLAVDDVVVKTSQGPKGALCSIRAW